MSDKKSNILAVLLDVKERNELQVDDKLIRECYELQKKFQFDPNRNTVEKMRELVEASLDKEGEQ
ncbi:MAG: hypothetical protein COB22_02200 [Cycloclasticus sp.]|nr:MAG: hypothetical protein COB22_02200 [Cycloclasticus sp.]